MQRCLPRAEVFAESLVTEVEAFRALADPARAAIVATLSRTDHAVCVCDLTEGLGLNQSTVSHHLKLLKDAGIVASERRGTWGYYSLARGVRARLASAVERVLARPVLA